MKPMKKKYEAMTTATMPAAANRTPAFVATSCRPNVRVIHRASHVISVPLKNCRTIRPTIRPPRNLGGDL